MMRHRARQNFWSTPPTLWGFVATPVGNDPLFNHVVLSWKELSRSKETLDDHSSSCTCAQRDLFEIAQLLNCPGRACVPLPCLAARIEPRHLRPAHFLLLWPPPRFSSWRYLAVATPEGSTAAQCVHKDQPPVPSAITALRPPLLSPLLKLFFTSSSVRMSTRTQLNLMGPKSACNLVIVKDLV
jgi:hypothetical protein